MIFKVLQHLHDADVKNEPKIWEKMKKKTPLLQFALNQITNRLLNETFSPKPNKFGGFLKTELNPSLMPPPNIGFTLIITYIVGYHETLVGQIQA